MMDWIANFLVSMLAVAPPVEAADVVAATAQAGPNLQAPASVAGVIMANLFTALPPTIAALTAMIVAMRASHRQEQSTVDMQAKLDSAKKQVEVAHEAVGETLATATEVKDIVTAHRQTMLAANAGFTQQVLESLAKNRLLMEQVIDLLHAERAKKK